VVGLASARLIDQIDGHGNRPEPDDGQEADEKARRYPEKN
jgi:hypothetical protein